MASIHRLNQPSNPRDFVNGNLENHPFFAPDGHRGHHGHRGRRAWDNAQQSNNTTGVAQSGKTTKPSDNIGKDGTSASDFDSPDNHRHHGHSGKCKNKAHGCPGHHGPDLFRGKGGKGKHGHGPHAGPYDFHSYDHDHYHATGAFGGPGFPGHPHNAGLFGFGPRRQGNYHKGGPGGRDRHHGGPSFGTPFEFLHQLSAGLGFLMNGPTAEGVDFAPSVDVFDCPDKYIVHVSLPGAKKGDLSLDYEADESVLHLAGVVYRPGVNEDLHKALVMEERGQHVGVFEREVRLGTRVPPAFVIVDQISAKLEDDVNVTLPKIVQHPEVGKKEVFVEDGDLENAKEALVVDEKTFSPVESEGSDVEEGEAREFVKVLVQ
ncbi:hypothetical protein NUH16_004005 [Penicillium rubens]|uniref:uncharacterized protein n=1 Tax=Penicillium rubens TaxID=1108849 RepID=UPI002A5ACF65|nr:uncharacterized protein N7525_010448 [Penicillium rubens]KAJ5036137.1 hypothetical protein NUH16_004005 [Penicillium rubens]KAJ5821164.1 hypothetical protein N7525_010448 [Penicillium rubens]KAJ5858813.1 hypothetical protein N7534_004090 [Penicillium rubens]